MSRLAALLALTVVTVGSDAARAGGARRLLLFGEGDHWLLVDALTHRAAPISFPLSNIENAAVSPDGKSFALIATDADRPSAVWIWNRGEASAKVLFSDGGRYSDPAFDTEGRWIYFSHSIAGVRPHVRGNYAQIFRTSPNGSSLEQITDEDGCHYGSWIVGGHLHYVHSSCSTSSWVQRRSAKGKTTAEVSTLGVIDEVAISPGGSAVLYVLNEPDAVSLWRLRLGEPATVLIRQRRTMQRLRPSFGRDEGEVLYQAAGAVWLLKSGTTRAIARMSARGSGT